jgi:tetratricopeptide (TPR) repeat protein
MTSLKDFIDFISALGSRAWTTGGGIAIAVAIATLDLIHVIPGSIPIQLRWTGILVMELCWLALWAWRSGRLVLPKAGTRTVAFCFRVDSEAERGYERVLSGIRLRLAGLRLPIRILRLDSAIIIDKDDALRFVQRQPIDLLIWGQCQYGTTDGKKESRYLVNASMARQIRTDTFRLYVNDLNLLVKGRKWTIEELNDLRDVDVLTADLVEVALGIVSIHLMMDGEADAAMRLLEQLIKEPAQVSPSSTASVQRLNDLLLNLYFQKAYAHHQAGRHPQAISILERVRPKLNPPALLVLARAYYLLGDVTSARAISAEYAGQCPDSAGAISNEAFFAILDRDYSRVEMLYELFLKVVNAEDVNLPDLYGFLVTEFGRRPQEYALLYAAGVVASTFDPKLATRELARFLKQSGRSQRRLRRRADALRARLLKR